MSDRAEEVAPIEGTVAEVAVAEGFGAENPMRAPHLTLSSRDQSILDFERTWTRHADAKEDAVHSEFGLTYARYYQVLNSIIDSPAALAYDPMLITRLQRMRESRTRTRTLLPHRSDTNPSSR